jgi:hypothetical protein
VNETYPFVAFVESVHQHTAWWALGFSVVGLALAVAGRLFGRWARTPKRNP